MTKTVRDATFEVLRARGLTRIFSNPGSTEVSLLTDLPTDLQFVLGLHEGSVIGMATGHALSTGRAALAIVHTTAGLGNAIGAIATARVNRAPLVIIVGQQDRRHLTTDPFLAGRLNGLGGDYPVWSAEPPRPQDVPSLVARAVHEATLRQGPALVVVPMDDWGHEVDEEVPLVAPAEVVVARRSDPQAIERLRGELSAASSPALVVGAGLDDARSWSAATELADALGCPVFQESFGARAGFPQDHPRFAGHLPAGRSRLRKALANHDVVLCLGALAFRQYPYEDGPLVEAASRVLVVTDDVEEATRSTADLAVLGDPAYIAAGLAADSDRRAAGDSSSDQPADLPVPVTQSLKSHSTSTSERLRAADVIETLAHLLPSDTVVVEETPSSRPDLHRLLPARAPLGFVSAAMGGLGFALPAAIGIKLGQPERPVVAVLGDGSSLYSIQALWSAAHYGVGTVFIVLANGRYAIMDRLADAHGEGRAPWPAFTEISVAGIARSFGCPVAEVADQKQLDVLLDELVPTLASRREPFLIEIAVEVLDRFEA